MSSTAESSGQPETDRQPVDWSAVELGDDLALETELPFVHVKGISGQEYTSVKAPSPGNDDGSMIVVRGKYLGDEKLSTGGLEIGDPRKFAAARDRMCAIIQRAHSESVCLLIPHHVTTYFLPAEQSVEIKPTS